MARSTGAANASPCWPRYRGQKCNQPGCGGSGAKPSTNLGPATRIGLVWPNGRVSLIRSHRAHQWNMVIINCSRWHVSQTRGTGALRVVSSLLCLVQLAVRAFDIYPYSRSHLDGTSTLTDVSRNLLHLSAGECGRPLVDAIPKPEHLGRDPTECKRKIYRNAPFTSSPPITGNIL